MTSREHIALLAKETLKRLNSLGAYIYHESVGGSVYIKFRDERMGSIRIADHPGRKKYKYRWNLRVDIEESRVKFDKIKRWYYRVADFEEMMVHILNYANKIVEADNERRA